MEHAHTWTWQWFGLAKRPYYDEGDPMPVGLRTCGCGEFERVEPVTGHTPRQQTLLDANNVKAEQKRAKMREYNQRKKA